MPVLQWPGRKAARVPIPTADIRWHSTVRTIREKWGEHADPMQNVAALAALFKKVAHPPQAWKRFIADRERLIYLTRVTYDRPTAPGNEIQDTDAVWNVAKGNDPPPASTGGIWDEGERWNVRS